MNLFFTLIVGENISSFIMDLINGNNWQDMLISRASYLKISNFHISFIVNEEGRGSNKILNSFKSHQMSSNWSL